VIAFEGQRSPSGVHFIGNKLTTRYDADTKTYFVSGSGTITGGNNRVELREGRIFLNDQEIPVRSTPLQILLTKDRKVENQFFD
jgi:hypothetical protein